MGAWICLLGAWICLLGVWNCLWGAWICLLGGWNSLLGVWNSLWGAWICLLGVWNSLLGVSHDVCVGTLSREIVPRALLLKALLTPDAVMHVKKDTLNDKECDNSSTRVTSPKAAKNLHLLD